MGLECALQTSTSPSHLPALGTERAVTAVWMEGVEEGERVGKGERAQEEAVVQGSGMEISRGGTEKAICRGGRVGLMELERGTQ